MVTPVPAAGDPIGRAAADWWARLRDSEPADETILQWLAWMEADARHAEAYEEVCRLGERLQSVDAVTRARLLREVAVPAPRHRWAAAGLAIAASLVLAVLGWRLAMQPRAGAPEHYASAIGQDRDIRLADGSTVALGGASNLTVRYAGARRDIALDAGEAFFTVTHDQRRPFVVAAGPVEIEDLGTAFNVRRTGDRVVVAVTEGRVRVQSPGDKRAGKEAGGKELRAGQQAVYEPRSGVFSISPVTAAQALAWRDNRLEFVDEPLSVVIANVNRYSRRPIQIADPRLGQLSFTGTVKINTIDSWIGALPRVFPVQVSAFADHVVLDGTAK
jgi:transmembrane sensor